jgi:3-dehydro-L-gulonate 2-dehydrogenase
LSLADDLTFLKNSGMGAKQELMLVPAVEMKARFESVLLKSGFGNADATTLAGVFTDNSIDGVYTHGVNRFPRFIEYVQKGFVQTRATPSLVTSYHGIEQWNGNSGAGILNALVATRQSVKLADEHGIGLVTLSNTNHWMRGGTYGREAAKLGCAFIGWTNTIANMPAWGAIDARLGNNPLVIAMPHENDAIVLDMAMSQYSFGAMELAQMKGEELPVYGGFDRQGELTKSPSQILESKRPVPIGFWKGAGLSLLLDILATVFSGGSSTADISKRAAEFGLSQVYIAISLKMGSQPGIAATVKKILDDYRRSIPESESAVITYPGERVGNTRKRNLEKGIPVIGEVWENILKL